MPDRVLFDYVFRIVGVFMLVDFKSHDTYALQYIVNRLLLKITITRIVRIFLEAISSVSPALLRRVTPAVAPYQEQHIALCLFPAEPARVPSRMLIHPEIYLVDISEPRTGT